MSGRGPVDCKYCGEPIYFKETRKGSMMPVNPDAETDGEPDGDMWDRTTMSSHFDTCKNLPAEKRKPKDGKEPRRRAL